MMVLADGAAASGSGLEALVRDCAASGVPRRVLLLRTDLLPPALSRPHHARLARAALEPLAAADRARMHETPGGCAAVSFRGDAAGLLARTIAGLRHLLDDAGPGAPALLDLVRLFDLPEDGALLLRLAGGSAPPPPAAPPPAPPQSRPSPAPPPVELATVDALERQLAGTDLSRFARREPVCRVSGAVVEMAWETRLLRLDELTAELTGRRAPRRDVAAELWLHGRLTRALDLRLLSLLSAPGELERAGPLSLDLAVSSVLSPDFLRFDAALPSGLRGSVVLGLHPADILADPAAFAFARSFVRSRGYRLLLQGMTAPLLRLMAIERLGLDYVQLRWSPDLPDALPVGPEIVLGQTHDAQALHWGQARGIALFQGRVLVRR